MKKYLLIPMLMMSLQLTSAEDADMDSNFGEFVWNELATPNVQKSKEFYNKMFGWEYEDKKVGDMTYTIVKKGDNEFGGIWEIPNAQQSQIPSHWLAYILVENVEQSVEKAKQNGATVVKPVQKAGEMGLFAILKDPTGAHIAFWQSLKK